MAASVTLPVALYNITRHMGARLEAITVSKLSLRFITILIILLSLLWTHAQRASMLYFAAVFYSFFLMAALVGETAERIFTKLSHVVDIRHHL